MFHSICRWNGRRHYLKIWTLFTCAMFLNSINNQKKIIKNMIICLISRNVHILYLCFFVTFEFYVILSELIFLSFPVPFSIKFFTVILPSTYLYFLTIYFDTGLPLVSWYICVLTWSFICPIPPFFYLWLPFFSFSNSNLFSLSLPFSGI